jgi:hypothetical protein
MHIQTQVTSGQSQKMLVNFLRILTHMHAHTDAGDIGPESEDACKCILILTHMHAHTEAGDIRRRFLHTYILLLAKCLYYIHIYIHIHTYTCMHIQRQMTSEDVFCIHIYCYLLNVFIIYTYTYTYIHTYTCMHIQRQVTSEVCCAYIYTATS